MKICDICKREVSIINELQDKWKCFDVKEVCNDCEKQLYEFNIRANEILDKIIAEQKFSFYKRMVNILKDKYSKVLN